MSKASVLVKELESLYKALENYKGKNNNTKRTEIFGKIRLVKQELAKLRFKRELNDRIRGRYK